MRREDLSQKLRTVVLAYATGLSGFLVAIPLIIAIYFLLRAVGSTPTGLSLVLLGVILLQGTAFPLTAAAFIKLRGLSVLFLSFRIPSRRDLLWVVGGYILALAGVIAAFVLIQATSAPTASRTDADLLGNPEVLLLMIPLSILVIGPGEELLFRGVVQGTLRKSFQGPASIVLASLAFVPAHIISLTGSVQALLVSFGVLFVPSLVFGLAYERTENLVVPALIHGLYNATFFGLTYLLTTLDTSQEAMLGLL